LVNEVFAGSFAPLSEDQRDQLGELLERALSSTAVKTVP
jgi:hypothetical protein